MAHRFIGEMSEGETIDEVYRVADRQLRANRNGNLYLQLQLRDRSGSVTGMLWNANERLYESIEEAEYLRVKGTTQFYNGALQMILNRIDVASTDSIDESDYVVLNNSQIEKIAQQLAEHMRAFSNISLLNLGECFLVDEALMEKFRRAPAGIKNHHAYEGGLMEHTVAVMDLAAKIADSYPRLDRDVLMMGAFLHDIGKIDELTYDRELGYSVDGQMVGHLVMGIEILSEKIQEAEKLSGEEFPEALSRHLRHIIASHHGPIEHGSIKLPMTLEAVMLYYIDNIDAKFHSLSGIIDSDANAGDPWTTFQHSIGRKLYKGPTS